MAWARIARRRPRHTFQRQRHAGNRHRQSTGAEWAGATAGLSTDGPAGARDLRSSERMS